MRIHLFNDHSAVLQGYNPHSLVSDKPGTLTVGSKVMRVSPDNAVPFTNVHDGTYMASFVADDGTSYDAGRVTVHNGGIAANRTYTERELELKHSLDRAEDRIASLESKVDVLEHIFDTDSLNFLIPPVN